MTGVQWVKARLASRPVRISALAAVVAGIVVWTAVLLLGGGEVKASAIFPEAKNLYPGDSVEILGVKVGSVDSVTPLGDGARVAFHYDSKYKVPAGAEAVIVAPELVSSRYLELTPAYTGGAVLAAGATIPQSRTAIPVEWDQMVNELNELVTVLGPDGANKNGAINRLLGTASEYQGQGMLFHDTIQKVSAAMQTLSSSRQNLFGNVRNLEVFTSALAASDQEITQFIGRLNTVSGVLDNNKQELAESIAELDATAPVVTRFISENGTAIKTATAHSAEVARLISSERLALENALQLAPTVLSNLYYIYDPLGHSETGALDADNFQNPAQFVCSAIGAAAQSSSPQAASNLCEKTAGPLLQLLQMNYPPVSANPLVRPGAPVAGPQGSTGTGTQPSAGSSSGSPSNLNQLLNPLGGL
jgi:phospholipid/cholesterol/gamma-HCH transport system substrate-binding protein